MESSSFTCKCGKMSGWVAPGRVTIPCPKCGRVYVILAKEIEGEELLAQRWQITELEEIGGEENQAFIAQQWQITELEDKLQEAQLALALHHSMVLGGGRPSPDSEEIYRKAMEDYHV